MTENDESLKAPMPYFGGKARVAGIVWEALGDVDNYVEPFAGSLAVLLGRPSDHQGTTETVNDADSYLCNLWRAISAAPDEVAKYASWPVNETDLIARHLWLVNTGKQRIASLESAPEFFDAKVAGWWLWGINSWIGSGWCSGNGPWILGEDGMIVDRRQLPHLGDAGQGVNRQLPHLGNRKAGDDLPQCWVDCSIQEYMNRLARRLRRVRVICGDWARAVTDGALSYGDSVGVFLDPPYQGDVRAKNLYRVDDHSISNAVREWAIAHGDDSRMKIVLAGYEEEHDAEIPSNWRRHHYSANKSYGTSKAKGTGNGNDSNRHKECLWFSPHCLSPGQAGLFG
jgi:site-specific DNA-adenine methylase